MACSLDCIQAERTARHLGWSLLWCGNLLGDFKPGFLGKWVCAWLSICPQPPAIFEPIRLFRLNTIQRYGEQERSSTQAVRWRGGAVCKGGLVVRWSLPYLPDCNATLLHLHSTACSRFPPPCPTVSTQRNLGHTPQLLPHVKFILCCTRQSEKKKLQRFGELRIKN